MYQPGQWPSATTSSAAALDNNTTREDLVASLDAFKLSTYSDQYNEPSSSVQYANWPDVYPGSTSYGYLPEPRSYDYSAMSSAPMAGQYSTYKQHPAPGMSELTNLQSYSIEALQQAQQYGPRGAPVRGRGRAWTPGAQQQQRQQQQQQQQQGPPHSLGGYRKMWNQVAQLNRHSDQQLMRDPRLAQHAQQLQPHLSVEDLLAIIRAMPPGTSVLGAVQHGLRCLDSRALAALLKELAKCNRGNAAVEIFTWLRSLDERHELYHLCDVYSYTTMIAQCGSHQQLRAALELVAEMRSRDIRANVHTYSALMNVCARANEPQLALDVYRQMRAEGCAPNLVTYNTLLDVYSKAGRWQDALDVLGVLREQGLMPEARTYTIVIAACNTGQQYSQAEAVYQAMLAAGQQPTAATYAAVITAYCRLGRLQDALGVFGAMAAAGMEHSLLTFNMLLGAAERAGDWRLCVELLQQMQREGVRPNGASYTAAISGVAAAGHDEKAAELLQLMQLSCRSDVPAVMNTLLALHDRCGRWREAYRLVHGPPPPPPPQLQSSSQQPVPLKLDGGVLSSLVELLWSAGSTASCLLALKQFEDVCRAGMFRLAVGVDAKHASVEFRLPAVSPALAIISLRRLCTELKERLARDGPVILKDTFILVVGEAAKDVTQLSDAVMSACAATGAPLKLVHCTEPGLHLVAASADVARWLTDADVATLLPAPTAPGDLAQVDGAALMAADQAAEGRCRSAWEAVRSFECECDWGAQVQTAADSAPWRAALLRIPASIHDKRQPMLQEEIMQDALTLVDRLGGELGIAGGAGSSSGTGGVGDVQPREDRPPAEQLAAACLLIAAQQGDPDNQLTNEKLAEMLDVEKDELRQATDYVYRALKHKTSAISALRLVQLYIERLGSGLHGAEHHTAAEQAATLVNTTHTDAMFPGMPPSQLAAAAIHAARRATGHWPYWPRTLAALTGYEDLLALPCRGALEPMYQMEIQRLKHDAAAAGAAAGAAAPHAASLPATPRPASRPPRAASQPVTPRVEAPAAAAAPPVGPPRRSVSLPAGYC